MSIPLEPQSDAQSATVECELHPWEPERLRKLRNHHISYLLICSAIIILSFVLETGSARRVSAFDWRLPELCGAQYWFGVDCPGCGLTRSFIHLAAGRWRESLAMHPVGWTLALAVVAQIPYRVWMLKELGEGRIRVRRWPRIFSTMLIVLLLGNWAIKMFSGA